MLLLCWGWYYWLDLHCNCYWTLDSAPHNQSRSSALLTSHGSGISVSCSMDLMTSTRDHLSFPDLLIKEGANVFMPECTHWERNQCKWHVWMIRTRLIDYQCSSPCSTLGVFSRAILWDSPRVGSQEIGPQGGHFDGPSWKYSSSFHLFLQMSAFMGFWPIPLIIPPR